MTSVRDLTIGYDSANPPTYKPILPLSSGHMIQFRAENPTDGSRITLTTRTSGTEPKVCAGCPNTLMVDYVRWNRSSITWRAAERTPRKWGASCHRLLRNCQTIGWRQIRMASGSPRYCPRRVELNSQASCSGYLGHKCLPIQSFASGVRCRYVLCTVMVDCEALLGDK